LWIYLDFMTLATNRCPTVRSPLKLYDSNVWKTGVC
jgi:hypothetical protein